METSDNCIHLSWEHVALFAQATYARICEINANTFARPSIAAYPIPNGGVYAGLAIEAASKGLGTPVVLVETPERADIYIDDVYDSGATIARIHEKHGLKFSFFLVDKRQEEFKGKWVTFPWERMSQQQKEVGLEDNIRRILQFIGEDVNREGLRDTPSRVVRSYGEIFSGYGKNPQDVMTCFECPKCDEMVVVKDIEFYSTCEHHMLPFFGTAHIAYIPNKRVIGVSKLARILEIYSRRLQIQEQLCQQVTDALMTHLQPKGAACVLEGKHFCMVCRGVQKQNSVMITSSLEGVFREPAVRAEFFSLIKS